MLSKNKVKTIYFNDYNIWKNILIKYFRINKPYKINKYIVSIKELEKLLTDTTINEDFSELLLSSETLSQNNLDDIFKLGIDFINLKYYD